MADGRTRLLGVVGSLLSGREGTVYECRRCGTTLEGDADACPECGAEEIASFRVD